MQLKTLEYPNIIKSPLNFTGGKYKLLPQILPLFPDNINTFVDLFCGGCNVSVNIKANKIICNDIDKKLVRLLSFFRKEDFNNLLVQIKEIIRDFNLSDSSKNGYSFYGSSSSAGLGKFNRDGFLALRNEFNSADSESEKYYTMLYVLIVYAFNNQIRFNAEGKYNLPVGKRDFNIRMQSKLKSFVEKLKCEDIIFTSKDFAKLRIDEFSENDFIYADPPYLITCATYNEKNWNETEEKRLLKYLDLLNSRQIKFALSNVLSTDNKTNVILKDWICRNKNYICHHLNYSYKNSNYHKKNIAKTDEVLITNY